MSGERHDAPHHIGKPTSRVDGRAKVTGEAKYAAEYNVPDLAYGCVVSSAIARGKITRSTRAEALELPGVIQVFTHENAPSLAWSDRSYRDQVAPPGSPFRPLHDAEIQFSGQPVALVVADSSSWRATPRRSSGSSTNASRTSRTWRRSADAPTSRSSGTASSRRPKPRGDADKAFAAAPCSVDAEYRMPVEHHNPMEPFATTVVWDEDGKLTVYDKTQGVQNVRDYLCSVFGLRRTRCASSRRSSAGRSAPGCARSTRCSWPSWRRAS